MLLHSLFLPPRAVAAGVEGGGKAAGTKGEPFLWKRGDSKAGLVHLPHAHSLMRAKLAALAGSQSTWAENGASPLSAGLLRPHFTGPPLCAKEMNLHTGCP